MSALLVGQPNLAWSLSRGVLVVYLWGARPVYALWLCAGAVLGLLAKVAGLMTLPRRTASWAPLLWRNVCRTRVKCLELYGAWAKGLAASVPAGASPKVVPLGVSPAFSEHVCNLVVSGCGCAALWLKVMVLPLMLRLLVCPTVVP